MMPESWMSFGPPTIGVVFVAASPIKVAAPFSFYRHISRLGRLSHRTVLVVVPATIGVEAGWGVALVLGVSPHAIVPFTAFALVALACLSW